MLKRTLIVMVLGTWLFGYGHGPVCWAQENEPDAEAVESDGDATAQAPREPTRISEVVEVGGNGRVLEGQEAPDMVVVFGSGTMEGKLRHDMVVVLGEARVDGEVGGDVTVTLTDLELGPNARIRGNLVVVGGSLIMDPSATVEGDKVDLSWTRLKQVPGFTAVERFLEGARDWFVSGLLLGRLLPPSWGWWWWMALAIAVLYVLLALIAPGPVAAGATEVERRPVASFFIGILGYVLANVVFLILIATGIGVLAVPFILIALLVVQLVGKASICQLVGSRIGGQLSRGRLARPLPALVIGLVVFTIVYMIPILGLFAWLVSAPLGFGAALIAMFGAFRGEPPTGGPGTAVGAIEHDVVEPERREYREPQPLAGPPPVIGSEPVPALSAAELTSLPRAGFWIRTAATLLDLLVILMPMALLEVGEYFLIPWIAYHVAMWSWRGTTVGGVVCRLRVVRLDGQPLSFAVSLVRSLASVLSAVALFLGFFWAGWTRERLSWHDMIAGTTIVRVPQGTSLL